MEEIKIVAESMKVLLEKLKGDTANMGRAVEGIWTSEELIKYLSGTRVRIEDLECQLDTILLFTKTCIKA